MAFEAFLRAFPAGSDDIAFVDGEAFAEEVRDGLGSGVPLALRALWSEIGCGYFGEGSPNLFGPRTATNRRLVEWNRESFWREVFPSPGDGGPVFFGETAFGDQIGYRELDGGFCAILFAVDTFESFVLAEHFDDLFEHVLNARDSVTDLDRLLRVQELLGALPRDRHFAPIVSPLVGGSDDATNFMVENPVVHLRTAIATHRALQQ